MRKTQGKAKLAQAIMVLEYTTQLSGNTFGFFAWSNLITSPANMNGKDLYAVDFKDAFTWWTSLVTGLPHPLFSHTHSLFCYTSFMSSLQSHSDLSPMFSPQSLSHSDQSPNSSHQSRSGQVSKILSSLTKWLVSYIVQSVTQWSVSHDLLLIMQSLVSHVLVSSVTQQPVWSLIYPLQSCITCFPHPLFGYAVIGTSPNWSCSNWSLTSHDCSESSNWSPISPLFCYTLVTDTSRSCFPHTSHKIMSK